MRLDQAKAALRRPLFSDVDTVELDYETYCDLDLSVVGLDVYSAHPSCRVLMCAYAFNGEEWNHWQESDGPFPVELRAALMDSRVKKWAFNAQFERVITNRVLKIPSPVKNWRCGMVLAYQQSFNGGLEDIGYQIGLSAEKRKDARGKALIKMFCGPHKVTKNNPHRIWNEKTHPDEWLEFCQYNVQDCVAERAQRRTIWKFRPVEIEWEYYEVDQIINDRGFPVDLKFVRNAIEMSNRRKAELLKQMVDITGLANPGSPKQLLPWLQERGYRFGDLNKESVEKVLTVHKARVEAGQDSVLTDDCVAALKLRQWQARLSVKKYDKILQCAGRGSRVRFMFQFSGAGRTCRWSGRVVQTQNLPRTPKILGNVNLLSVCTDIIRSGDYEMLELFIDEPMEAFVGCVRSSFRASKGYHFVVSDLSSIETAVIAWLTDCKGLLEALRTGRDPYKVFASFLFNKPYDQVTKFERQICKPVILGCGYRLGGGEIYDGKRSGLWGYAEGMGVELSKEDSHKQVKLYRELYPEVPDAWKGIEQAVARTMRTGLVSTYGRLKFEREKPYLKMILPSGSAIYYMSPQMKTEIVSTGRYVTKIATKEEDYFLYGAKIGEEYEVEETYSRLAFTYKGKHQKTGQWLRMVNHGGRFIEQATQKTARDIFCVGMKRAHKSGFRLVAHSHDENIAEQRIDCSKYNVKFLSDCMKEPITWAPGLPLNAAGYSNPFYMKD